jgi:microcystin-dependent protein
VDLAALTGNSGFPSNNTSDNVAAANGAAHNNMQPALAVNFLIKI